jgi:hypothetical protein
MKQLAVLTAMWSLGHAKAPVGEDEAGGGAEQAGAAKPKDEKVVDADFEEVKSDKK